MTRFLILGVSVFMMALAERADAGEKGQIVQLAKLEIDPAQLDAYKPGYESRRAC